MTEQCGSPVVYQLWMWLRGVSPMVWRRLLVRSDSTLAECTTCCRSPLPGVMTICTVFVFTARSLGFRTLGAWGFLTTQLQCHWRGFGCRHVSAFSMNTISTTTECMRSASSRSCRLIPQGPILVYTGGRVAPTDIHNGRATVSSRCASFPHALSSR